MQVGKPIAIDMASSRSVTRGAAVADSQSSANERLWRRDNVARYANRTLRPVEVILLARYREAFGGRVVELGCGAGRILGYLATLGGDVHGIDISPEMVAYCRQRYPEATVHVGNLMDITAVVPGRIDVVVALDNILDVLEPSQRSRALEEIRESLAPNGLLIFSSHNLAHADRLDAARARTGSAGVTRDIVRRVARTSPIEMAAAAGCLLRGVRNRRRLAPLQRHAADHAILNDAEGDYGALHYYVRRDDQERQLGDAGYVLIECLDAEGVAVRPGSDGDSPWLHYVARAA